LDACPRSLSPPCLRSFLGRLFGRLRIYLFLGSFSSFLSPISWFVSIIHCYAQSLLLYAVPLSVSSFWSHSCVSIQVIPWLLKAFAETVVHQSTAVSLIYRFLASVYFFVLFLTFIWYLVFVQWPLQQQAITVCIMPRKPGTI
jgi:hypothetical protein